MKLEFRKWLLEESSDEFEIPEKDPVLPVYWLVAGYPYLDGEGFSRMHRKRMGDRRGGPFRSLDDAAAAFERRIRSDHRLGHLSIAPFLGKSPLTFGDQFRAAGEYVWNERPHGPRDNGRLEQTIARWDALRPGGPGNYGTGADRPPPVPRMGELDTPDPAPGSSTFGFGGESTPPMHSAGPITTDDPNRTAEHPGNHSQVA